jgi:hypothetical protein
MKEFAATVWLTYLLIGFSIGATWPVWIIVMLAIQ